MAAAAAAAVSSTARAASKFANKPGPLIAKSGEHIFVYTNIRTSQTIYSLSRSMRNKDALQQLTFVGKKSVPAALRKDMWSPLCVLSFPSAEQGLDAYRKLREFRILHETQWDRSEMVTRTKDRDGNERDLPMTKKQRTKALQNQKANSVADMAAVLLGQERTPSAEEWERARWWHELPKVQTRRGLAIAPDRPRFGKGSKASLGDVVWRGSVKGVKINWTNILDAEYAQTWPGDVLHGSLDMQRYRPVWPPTNEASRSVEEETREQLGDTAVLPAQQELEAQQVVEEAGKR